MSLIGTNQMIIFLSTSLSVYVVLARERCKWKSNETATQNYNINKVNIWWLPYYQLCTYAQTSFLIDKETKCSSKKFR